MSILPPDFLSAGIDLTYFLIIKANYYYLVTKIQRLLKDEPPARIRYINVELAKPVDDFFSDSVGNTTFVIDVGRIAVQLKSRLLGAQVAERNRWRRILQHIGIFRRNIQKCLPHQCNVAVIIDADCNFRRPMPLA